jgi:subtilisin family serine protease
MRSAYWSLCYVSRIRIGEIDFPMSGPVRLNYGVASFELRRSEQFVAVRSVGSPAELSPNGAELGFPRTRLSEHSRIGNYAVLEIEAGQAQIANEQRAIRESAPRGTVADVYHSSADMVAFVPTGTIYLEFEHGVPDSSKNELMARHGLAVARTERDGAVTLRVTEGSKNAVETSAALQKEPIVKVAEPDLATEGEVKGFAIPDDALFGRQWHLENSGQIGGEAGGLKAGADARVLAAWRLMQGFGSPEVVIGIIDDGFDLDHPDLSTRFVHAWDFKRNGSDVAPEPNLTAPTTGNWHGTACAGVAVGALNGGKVIGAAPACSWMPVRWSALEPMEVMKWFDHMREKGAWVISCSWGARAKNYPLPTRIAKSIAQCAAEGRNGKGCVVVFASGNEGRDIDDSTAESVNGFATHADVIAVGASTSADEYAAYSNFGKRIWVCAPSSGGGHDITTTDVTGEFIDSIGMTRPKGYVPGDYYEHFGKTSSACPLVAGICGLMLSANTGLTAAEVREILRITARRIGDPALYDAGGHSNFYGYGCVNAEAAVAEARARLPSA